MTVAAPRRPRISHEFIAAHQRRRILAALADLVADRGYRPVTVAHIVAGAGIARNTFYDNYRSKDDAGRALLAAVGQALIDAVEARPATRSAFVMAVEIMSPQLAGRDTRASAALAEAWHVLAEAAQFVAEPLELSDTDGDPLLSTLPPGKHGLGGQFVRRNQRRRLIDGTARSLYETGYEAATIADITRHAAVSRRTFYEHFDGKQRAVDAMVDYAKARFDAPGVGPSHRSGFEAGVFSLWADIVGAMLVGERGAAVRICGGGHEVLRALDEVIA